MVTCNKNKTLLFRTALMLALLAPLSHCGKAQRVKPKGGRGKGHIVKLVLDQTLPEFSTSFSSRVANLSLSPWVYREECVDSRIPRCLFHAHCLTSGCVHPQWGHEDLSLEAKPIYYQLLVLHRWPKGRKSQRGSNWSKRYAFRLGTEVVSAGCTCVRPSIIQTNS
uniref:Uncharacterized protein n=1 Tax=Neogobius melanostomus TaxID=47308 RepID=A0A8C6V368_9GOBI